MALRGKLLTVISLFVAVIVATATILSTQASIDFWLERPASLTPGLNHITVYCRNGGGMDGDFYLRASFINASISNQTEMPYSKMDDATVRTQFVLHKGDSGQRTICFICENVTGFSVNLTLERTGLLQYIFLKANALFPTQLNYSTSHPEGNFTVIAP